MHICASAALVWLGAIPCVAEPLHQSHHREYDHNQGHRQLIIPGDAAAVGHAWEQCRFANASELPFADASGAAARETLRAELMITGMWWFHVPKTGQDFERYLRSAAAVPTDVRDKAWDVGHKGFPDHGQRPCLSVPWSSTAANPTADASARYPMCAHPVGFFRDPMQRLLSQHFHSTAMTWYTPAAREAHGQALAQGWGLGRRIEAMVNVSKPCVLAGYTKMLIGMAVGQCHAVSPLEVALAVARVGAFAFVGLTDDWYASLCLFRALTNDRSAPLNLQVHTGHAHSQLERVRDALYASPEQLRQRGGHVAVSQRDATVAVATAAASMRPGLPANSVPGASLGPSIPSSASAAGSLDALLDATALRNPRCEGLDVAGERFCAGGRLHPSGGVEYRASDLLPGLHDCADEVVFRAAAAHRDALAAAARTAEALLSHELRRGFRVSPLPAACQALDGEVRRLLADNTDGAPGSTSDGGRPPPRLSREEKEAEATRAHLVEAKAHLTALQQAREQHSSAGANSARKAGQSSKGGEAQREARASLRKGGMQGGMHRDHEHRSALRGTLRRPPQEDTTQSAHVRPAPG